MASTFTPNLGLNKPATSDRNWDVALNGNANAIDATFLGGLAVQLVGVPSASLVVAIAPGNYCQNSGVIAAYAGGTVTVPASSTTMVWLTDVGVLTIGSAWPTVNHVRLAVVVSGATTITSVTDARVAARSCGHHGITVYEGGTDPRMGLATLVGGTATINTSAITAVSRIFLTNQSPGGTPGFLETSTRVAGASFTITSSSSSDTSQVAWILFEPG